MASDMNVGVRHVLLVYQSAAASACPCASLIARLFSVGRYSVAAALLFQFATSLRPYPTYIPHANELFVQAMRLAKMHWPNDQLLRIAKFVMEPS